MRLSRIKTIAMLAVSILSTASAWAAPPEADLRLSGVLFSSSGRAALISGQVVEEGDRIAGAEVVAIEDTSVVLRSGGDEIVLRIGSRARPRPRSVVVARAEDEVEAAVEADTDVASAPRAAPRAADDRATKPTRESRGEPVHRVVRGQTLSGIVAAYYAADPRMQDRAMVALYEAHPSAFGGSMNVLFEGARLRIPESHRLRRIRWASAAAEVARHRQLWRQARATPRDVALHEAEIRYGPVAKGETLSAIAARERPEGVTLDQMMMALFDANPEAFGGNVNVLYEGATLSIPELGRSPGRDRARASAEVAWHMERWGSRPMRTTHTARAPDLLLAERAP